MTSVAATALKVTNQPRETEGDMKNRLIELRASLQALKEASMFRKAEAAEVSLLAALVLLEEMVAEIDKLKRAQAKDKKAIEALSK